jgi:hypothetical protein
VSTVASELYDGPVYVNNEVTLWAGSCPNCQVAAVGLALVDKTLRVSTTLSMTGGGRNKTGVRLPTAALGTG